ncbi:hypothetical protein ACFSM5_09990 [Lacibacterium aquatile]|uniref:Uncharacterized protein n=1 Tax=Lacibacterium aquatile TaxID=1168082 RepID=A0ABW5DQD0_9PROT
MSDDSTPETPAQALRRRGTVGLVLLGGFGAMGSAIYYFDGCDRNDPNNNCGRSSTSHRTGLNSWYHASSNSSSSSSSGSDSSSSVSRGGFGGSSSSFGSGGG